MNFLAHLYLADLNSDSLVGHLLGDFVKGRTMDDYSPPIRRAIRRHRKIDTYCDSHPVTRISRNRIGPSRRRFAGILVDVGYDHFLARHWHRFNTQSLQAFTQGAYAALQCDRTLWPKGFEAVLSRLITHDWLGSYGHLDKVAVALDRIAGRLSRGERFMGGIADIQANYRGLEDDFLAFFPDLIRFSKDINYEK